MSAECISITPSSEADGLKIFIFWLVFRRKRFVVTNILVAVFSSFRQAMWMCSRPWTLLWPNTPLFPLPSQRCNTGLLGMQKLLLNILRFLLRFEIYLFKINLLEIALLIFCPTANTDSRFCHKLAIFVAVKSGGHGLEVRNVGIFKVIYSIWHYEY